MRDLALVGALVGGGAGVYVVLITPSWLFLGMNRSCLWGIRDEVFDARRQGLLADIKDVELLIDRIEFFIVCLPFLSPVSLARLTRQVHVEPEEGFLGLRLDELSTEQRAKAQRFVDETLRVLVRNYFTSTWTGLLFFALVHPGDLKLTMRPAQWHAYMQAQAERRARAGAVAETLSESEEITRRIISATPSLPRREAERRADLMAAAH